MVGRLVSINLGWQGDNSNLSRIWGCLEASIREDIEAVHRAFEGKCRQEEKEDMKPKNKDGGDDDDAHESAGEDFSIKTERAFVEDI